MTKEVGTLEELNVKPGDVVEFVEGYNGMYPQYKGKRMVGHSDGGVSFDNGNGFCGDAYHKFRIVSRASDRPEPKVETVTLYGSPSKHIQWCLEQCDLDTHRITFNLIDGEPDCTSIKMEKL